VEGVSEKNVEVRAGAGTDGTGPAEGVPKPPVDRRGRRLGPKDRELISLLGVCRYLTVRQMLRVGRWATTAKAMQYRLRGLSGDGTAYKVRPIDPSMLRPIGFRAFDGEPQQLWALTTAGYAVAGADLGRPLRVPRLDVGAAFAEHFVLLTDLFVELVRPYLLADVAVAAVPFLWDVTEQVELPWREGGPSGRERMRVVRPDAVLEIPSAHRRYFVECETGSHTLLPRSPEKHQATLRKLERYDDYVCGLADRRAGLSHYQVRYPDGWPCEVLFLVPSKARQESTASLLATFRSARGSKSALARALVLPETVAYLRRLLPTSQAAGAPHGTTADVAFVPFYGEPEHRAVKTFVLEMSAALNQANMALRRRHLPQLSEPPSSAGMRAFLKRAREEMQRRRGSPSNSAD
jgi:hypothetical protein